MSKAMKHVLELVEQTLEEAGIDGKADFKINLVGDMVLTEQVDVTFEDILKGV